MLELVGIIISLLVLLLSVYGLWRKHTSDKKADLSVDLNKDDGKVTLTISNEGKAPARNIRVEMPDSNKTLSAEEVKKKFPYKSLEVGKSVELITRFHPTVHSKDSICLIWDDDSGNNNKKDCTYSL